MAARQGRKQRHRLVSVAEGKDDHCGKEGEKTEIMVRKGAAGGDS